MLRWDARRPDRLRSRLSRYLAARGRRPADAVPALINLGYGRSEAHAAIAKAAATLGEQAAVDALIRTVRDAHGQPMRYSGVDIDVTDRKRLEEHDKLLLAELNHRVKNTIALIQSIAKQSLAAGRPLEEARDAFLRRLHALAHTHSLLTEGEWRGARLSGARRR